MRIRVNRLVYSLIGIALAAGLLVTAFARPEPALTASTTCYGRCATATVLSFSPATVVLGHENVVVFKVKVHALVSGNGKPAGLVIVHWGHVILCTIIIKNGSGHCSPPRAKLPLGSHTIVASYVGNGTFAPSTSAGETLTVVWR